MPDEPELINPVRNQAGVSTITVGGQVLKSILIAGNSNQVFVGAYEPLTEAYIEPWPVFDRVKVDDFTGRQWLIKRIDSFLEHNDRGYLVLEADAGLGKTTFLAYLVRTRGYVHHFGELAPGADGIVVARKNLAAQLIRAWALDPLPATGAHEPSFIDQILREASRARDNYRPAEKIVIVVDGLDEAGASGTYNAIGLPRVLPRGVYIVVSQRLGLTPIRVDGPRELVSWTSGDEENLNDMRAYLERALAQGIFRPSSVNSEPPSLMVDALLKRCGGVWIYLHHLIAEMERPGAPVHPFDMVPNGLWLYYADFWDRWRRERQQSTWHGQDLRLLAALAVLREPVSLSRLCIYAGVVGVERVRTLLDETWRPFLTTERTDFEIRYRLYHASLRDFLQGHSDTEALAAAEQALTQELARAARDAHAAIADRYISSWGGFEAQLIGLTEPSKRDVDEGYGVRHVTTHLRGAGRVDDIHHLLRLEWSSAQGALDGRLQAQQFEAARKNVWWTVEERLGQTDLYLEQVEKGWSTAEEQSRGEIQQGDRARSVGMEIRYGLMASSVRSLSQDFSPATVVGLVQHEIRPAAQVLGYVRQMRNPVTGADALIGLGPYLPRPLLAQALHMTSGLEDDAAKSRAVAALKLYAGLSEFPRVDCSPNPQLPGEDRRPSGGNPVQSTEPDERADSKLGDGALPMKPKRDQLMQSLETARSNPYGRPRAQMLVGLARYLAPSDQKEVVKEALRAADSVRFSGPRTAALLEVSRGAASLGHIDLAREAARGIDETTPKVNALVAIATNVVGRHRIELFGEAIEAAARAGTEVDRAALLLWLLPQLPQVLRERALIGAFTAVRAVQDPVVQACTILRLIPMLDDSTRHQAVDIGVTAAYAISYSVQRAELLTSLASWVPDPSRQRILEDALRAAQAIEDSRAQDATVAALAPALARLGSIEQALAVAQHIDDGGFRAEALVKLAPYVDEDSRKDFWQDVRKAEWGLRKIERLIEVVQYLPEPERSRLLAHGLTIAGNRKDEGTWAHALAALAPHLPEALIPDALTQARGLEPGPRAVALTGLVPYLSETLRADAIVESLAALQLGQHRNVRNWGVVATGRHPRTLAEAFGTLTPYLPESLFPVASELALKLDAGSEGATATAAFVSRLAHSGHPAHALGYVQSIESEAGQADAFVALAPHLSQPLLSRAIDHARRFSDTSKRAKALAGLARFAAEPLRTQVVMEALASDDRRNDEGTWAEALLIAGPILETGPIHIVLEHASALRRAECRAAVFAGLSLSVAIPERDRLLSSAVAALNGIGEPDVRTEMLKRLIAPLLTLPLVDLHRLWAELLHAFAGQPRSSMLVSLREMTPVIVALGGAQAVAETIDAIQDVGRWWP